MAHPGPPGQLTDANLFNGLRFWLSAQVPQRSHYIEKIRTRGGSVIAQEAQADLRIVDHAKKPPAGPGYHTYKFIDDSVRQSELQDLDQYTVGLKSAADRRVGDVVVASKTTRNPFTAKDDQLLFNWVEPYRQAGGSWKGNEIYKQLARKHPHHTFQSWRSRYLSTVSNNTTLTITERIEHVDESEDNIAAPPLERSPKRRRLNEAQPENLDGAPRLPVPGTVRINPLISPVPKTRSSVGHGHLGAAETEQMTESVNSISERVNEASGKISNERQQGVSTSSDIPDRLDSVNSTKPDDTNSTELNDDQTSSPDGAKLSDRPLQTPGRDTRQEVEQGRAVEAASELRSFTNEDARQLYRAVPIIHSTAPEDLDACWERMAEFWSDHTVAEWRLYYETTVLPEYMRRNNLETKDDLDSHIGKVLEKRENEASVVPPVKKEDIIEHSPNETLPNMEQEHILQNEKGIPHDDRRGNKPPMEDGGGILPAIQRSSASAEPHPDPEILTQHLSRGTPGGYSRDHQQSEAVLHRPFASSAGPISSQISPKKKLFGRKLNAELLSSQSQTVDILGRSNLSIAASFSNIHNKKGIRLSNSQVSSESKLPPESGQRPPKSVTTSQEERPVLNTVDQLQEEIPITRNASDEMFRSLPETQSRPEHSRESSPTLNLIGDPAAPENGNSRSSPVLSDTGSEYMAFDTAPERSQLWDPDESNLQESIAIDNADDDDDDDDDEEEEEEDNISARFRVTQYSPRNIFRKRVQTMREPGSVDSSASERSASQELETAKEHFGILNETGTVDAAEEKVDIVLSHRVTHRLETQKLFQQVETQADEYSDLFGLPAPEGGWEQLGDVEDEADEVRTSVEFADYEPLKRRIASSSHADEAAMEPEYTAQVDKVPLVEEIREFTDEDSEHTILSEEGTALMVEHPIIAEPVVVAETDSRVEILHEQPIPMIQTTMFTEEDDVSSEEPDAITAWVSKQFTRYQNLSRHNCSRLISTALQATVMNLSAATFTLRDLIIAFEALQAKRRTEFENAIRLKRELTSGTPQPKFSANNIKLSEHEARMLLPQDVLGVWTIDDDKDFISKTPEGVRRVEQKHGAAGVRKRAKFLRSRYGLIGPSEVVVSSPVMSLSRSRG